MFKEIIFTTAQILFKIILFFPKLIWQILKWVLHIFLFVPKTLWGLFMSLFKLAIIVGICGMGFLFWDEIKAMITGEPVHHKEQKQLEDQDSIENKTPPVNHEENNSDATRPETSKSGALDENKDAGLVEEGKNPLPAEENTPNVQKPTSPVDENKDILPVESNDIKSGENKDIKPGETNKSEDIGVGVTTDPLNEANKINTDTEGNSSINDDTKKNEIDASDSKKIENLDSYKIDNSDAANPYNFSRKNHESFEGTV